MLEAKDESIVEKADLDAKAEANVSATAENKKIWINRKNNGWNNLILRK